MDCDVPQRLVVRRTGIAFHFFANGGDADRGVLPSVGLATHAQVGGQLDSDPAPRHRARTWTSDGPGNCRVRARTVGRVPDPWLFLCCRVDVRRLERWPADRPFFRGYYPFSVFWVSLLA